MKPLKRLTTWVLLGIFLITFQFGLGRVHAAANQEEIDLNTTPGEIAFNLSNLKPGDWANQTVTIQNDGKQDFIYNTKSVFHGGSEKLYNEILLQVSDSDTMLYEGKLKDFKEISPRKIEANKQEDLVFRIDFPYELENEFQGLGFEVEFQFFVTGDKLGKSEDPVNPTDTNDSTGSPHDNDPQPPSDGMNIVPDDNAGDILPSTSTNIYNFAILGALLILIGSTIFFIQRRKMNMEDQ